MKPPNPNGIGRILLPLCALLTVATVVLGQRPEIPPADSRPRGPGRGGGPGGVREDIMLVQQFDQDGNKRLDAGERNAAREFLAKERAEGRSQTRGPRRPPRNENNDPPKPVFINNDGYWIRASDYELDQDSKDRFHVIPDDANETFSYPQRGGRMGGGQEVRGVELDPLAGSTDASKPLLYRLLPVPALRARYLAHVRTLAEQWLDWKKLGPLATQSAATNP